MKILLSILIAVFVVCSVGLSDEKLENGKKAKTADEIRREIRRLKAKVNALEEQARKTEHDEERRRRLHEIQRESRRRLEGYKRELKEMQNELKEQDEIGPAQRELLMARIAHISVLQEIDKKICSLKPPASLEEAGKLMDKLELIQTRWEMVDEPKFELYAELESMENEANEINDENATKIITELRTLGLKYIKDSKKLFELWKSTWKTRKKAEALTRKFWKILEEKQRQAEPDEDEHGDD